MMGLPNPLTVGRTIKWGRVLLIFLYALTFYFGPQFEGGFKPENAMIGVRQVSAGQGGFLWMDLFADRFELNQY